MSQEIPELVWDSAIAAGWWRLASETHEDIFPEPLGHYWVWRDDGRDWKGLFRAEVGDWEAMLLEHTPMLPVASPSARPRPELEDVRDQVTGAVGAKTKNNEDKALFPDRAVWLAERLRERSWNKHDLARHSGPDYKTIQKILDGRPVREDVLEKVARALSAIKNLPVVNLLEIPQS